MMAKCTIFDATTTKDNSLLQAVHQGTSFSYDNLPVVHIEDRDGQADNPARSLLGMCSSGAKCRLSRLSWRLCRLLKQLPGERLLDHAGRSWLKMRGLARDPWTLAGFFFWGKKSRLSPGGRVSHFLLVDPLDLEGTGP